MTPSTHPVARIPIAQARLDAVIKRLAANRDNMAIVSLFAWGRMTFTIKDGEARELWKPKRAEALAIFAYLYVNRCVCVCLAYESVHCT